jgi:hypothetical protein
VLNNYNDQNLLSTGTRYLKPSLRLLLRLGYILEDIKKIKATGLWDAKRCNIYRHLQNRKVLSSRWRK